MHKVYVSWLISASMNGRVYFGGWCQWCHFLKHLPSLMHLLGGIIFAQDGEEKKTISLPAKVEKTIRVRLYRNFPETR